MHLRYDEYKALREASGFRGHAGRPGQRGGSAHNPPPPGVEAPEDVVIAEGEPIEEHIKPVRKYRHLRKQANDADTDFNWFTADDWEYYYGTDYEPMMLPSEDFGFEMDDEEPPIIDIGAMEDLPLYAEAPTATDIPAEAPKPKRPRGPRTFEEIRAQQPFEFEKYAGKYEPWRPRPEDIHFPVTGGVIIRQADGRERYFSSPEQAENYYREYNLAQAERAQELAKPSWMQRFAVAPGETLAQTAREVGSDIWKRISDPFNVLVFDEKPTRSPERLLPQERVDALMRIAQSPDVELEGVPPFVIRQNQTVAVFHPDGTTSYFEDIPSFMNYYGDGPKPGDQPPVRLGTPVTYQQRRERIEGPTQYYEDTKRERPMDLTEERPELSLMPDTALGRLRTEAPGLADVLAQRPMPGSTAEDAARAQSAAEVMQRGEEAQYVPRERALRDATRRIFQNAMSHGYSEEKARQLANKYYRRRAEEEYRQGRIRKPRFMESLSYQEYCLEKRHAS